MKTAIITGCAGGIGAATVKKFLSCGWFVVGMDVAEASVAQAILGTPDHFEYLRGDLSSNADRTALTELAVKEGRTVHALVNVAGVAPKVRADILEMTEESYDWVMNINTKGTLFLTQTVAKK